MRLRNRTIDEIMNSILDSITPCSSTNGLDIREALDGYWRAVGVKDMDLLCQEEPDLCAKIKRAEGIILSRTR